MSRKPKKHVVSRLTAYGLRLTVCAAAALLVPCLDAPAQPYPTKPIRLIVPFAAGGPNDILARLVTPKLSEWGQAIVVENRGGAAGTIGMEALSKLPGDGYALGMGGSSNLAVAPALYEKLGYDPVKDFTPVINVASVPYALAINPSVPARTVKELVAIASRKPRYLSYGSSGNGSMSNLAAELFKALSKTDIVHVPYKGTAPALTDVVTGQIEVMFADLGIAQTHAKAGRLRLLGISTATRSPAAPQLPTIAEAGIAGYEVNPWFAIVGPAGMPREIVTKLNAAVAAALNSTEVRQRLQTLGYEPLGGSPEALATTIKADLAKYAKVVKTAGIKPQ